MHEFLKLAADAIGVKSVEQATTTSAAGIAGVIAAHAFGGWPSILTVLTIMIVVDYVTGVMAAGTEGKLRSKVGMIGIARKVFILFIVAIAHQVDIVLGGNDWLRDGTIFFYMANELLSIIENGGRLGVPIPDGLAGAIEQLQGKSGKKKGDDKQ
ncbi:phage holin family protein [Paenibacillus apiarius]|uniref:phage holin family protein n=1 Tax=Paenibacillus apiarius TaxID=46240 RepID=UPI003B3AD50B